MGCVSGIAFADNGENNAESSQFMAEAEGMSLSAEA